MKCSGRTICYLFQTMQGNIKQISKVSYQNEPRIIHGQGGDNFTIRKYFKLKALLEKNLNK